MRIESELKLDFDDVLIRPKRSVAPSRASVDLKREFLFRAAQPAGAWTGIPVIAANLDTTGTMQMAAALHELNMLTCLHKYYAVEELIEFFTRHPARNSAFYTLGIRDDDFEKLQAFVGKAPAAARLICIDAANGYTKFFVDRVKHVRDLCPAATIMAGNVATPEMVQELLDRGPRRHRQGRHRAGQRLHDAANDRRGLSAAFGHRGMRRRGPRQQGPHLRGRRLPHARRRRQGASAPGPIS